MRRHLYEFRVTILDLHLGHYASSPDQPVHEKKEHMEDKGEMPQTYAL